MDTRSRVTTQTIATNPQAFTAQTSIGYLLEGLIEVISSGNEYDLETWLQLAVAVGITDLFDSNGQIKPFILTKEHEKNPIVQAMHDNNKKTFLQRREQQEVALLKAYLIKLICEPALAVFKRYESAAQLAKDPARTSDQPLIAGINLTKRMQALIFKLPKKIDAKYYQRVQRKLRQQFTSHQLQSSILKKALVSFFNANDFIVFLTKPSVQEIYSRTKSNPQWAVTNLNGEAPRKASRHFDNFPIYSRIIPLLQTVKEAAKSTDAIKTWAAYAQMLALDDLFDNHGNLKKDVCKALKLTTAESSNEKYKKSLFAAYLNGLVGMPTNDQFDPEDVGPDSLREQCNRHLMELMNRDIVIDKKFIADAHQMLVNTWEENQVLLPPVLDYQIGVYVNTSTSQKAYKRAFAQLSASAQKHPVVEVRNAVRTIMHVLEHMNSVATNADEVKRLTIMLNSVHKALLVNAELNIAILAHNIQKKQRGGEELEAAVYELKHALALPAPAAPVTPVVDNNKPRYTHVYTLEDDALVNSENASMQHLKACGWIAAAKDNQSNNFNRDVRRDNTFYFSGKSLHTFEPFKNAHNDAATCTQQEAAAIDLFVDQFFKKNNVPKSSRQYLRKLLRQHYSQIVIQGVYNSINASIMPEHMLIRVTKDYINLEKRHEFKFQDGRLYFEDNITNMYVISEEMIKENKLHERIAIPGTAKATYVLTEDGFVLDSISTTNSLLAALCLRKHVDLTPEVLAIAAKEEQENTAKLVQEAQEETDYHALVAQVRKEVKKLEKLQTTVHMPTRYKHRLKQLKAAFGDVVTQVNDVLASAESMCAQDKKYLPEVIEHLGDLHTILVNPTDENIAAYQETYNAALAEATANNDTVRMDYYGKAVLVASTILIAVGIAVAIATAGAAIPLEIGIIAAATLISASMASTISLGFFSRNARADENAEKDLQQRYMVCQGG